MIPAHAEPLRSRLRRNPCRHPAAGRAARALGGLSGRTARALSRPGRGGGAAGDECRGRRHRARLRGGAGRHRALVRRHRAGRRPDHGAGAVAAAGLDRAAEPRPRQLSGRKRAGGRGGGDPRRCAGGGGGDRPAVPAVAGLGRLVPDRRQPVDQCRRGAGAALRHRARTVPGARGGAARRLDLARAAPAAQGQHRLRSAGSAGRRRGHPGHHHRRGAEALSAPRTHRHRAAGGRQPGGGAGPAGDGRGADRRGDQRLRTDRRPGPDLRRDDAAASAPAVRDAARLVGAGRDRCRGRPRSAGDAGSAVRRRRRGRAGLGRGDRRLAGAGDRTSGPCART